MSNLRGGSSVGGYLIWHMGNLLPFVGATASVNGVGGLVLAPLIANRLQYLKGDGTWGDPPGTASAVDNILDGSNSGTAITYAPYTAQQAKLSLDSSTTNPARTDRLNLNGAFYATSLNGISAVNVLYGGLFQSAWHKGTLVISATAPAHEADKVWIDKTGKKIQYSDGTNWVSVSGSGFVKLDGTDPMTGALVVNAKGSTLGNASGGLCTTTIVTSVDANILFYKNSETNWAGIGCDEGGNIWFKVDISQNRIPNFRFLSNGDLHVVGNGYFGGVFVNSNEVLHVAGGQTVLKNNPAISTFSYAGANNTMELRTSDGSNPILGFHRAGYTAVALYHSDNFTLRIQDANSGLNGRILTVNNSGNIAGHFDDTTATPSGTTRMNYSGYLYTTKLFNAVFNDYAEYFEKDDKTLEAGDVVVRNEIGDGYIKSTKAYDRLVVGVVSDTFGNCLGGKGDDDDDENFAPIGMAGRVKVKVVGKVKKGDLLVSSRIPGVAMSDRWGNRLRNLLLWEKGSIVGKALEDYDGSEGIKRVWMFIMVSR